MAISARISFLIVSITLASCHGLPKQNTESDHNYTNELIHESSPYLLQHAHNPVNWYPWGEEAFKKARDENKLLLISIGYAACHWCHVMENESFEDLEVANFMNDNFICIKVDREERPDVDQIYMTAVQLITGRGGWPLNALALADGKPFYAGTYFPKSNWLKVLKHFTEINRQDPQSLADQAERVTKGIQTSDQITLVAEEELVSMEDLDLIFRKWKTSIDFKRGGENKAPKFPMPSAWEYLLEYHFHSENPDALRAVKSTLDHMAFGGIYDQLGGGFARYSTDATWKVPHFEKMLYDNAQLISLYSKAYQLTQDPLYQQVVEETIEFLDREFLSPQNGYFSSLDADSDGEEGKYYVWTKKEISSCLHEKAPLFIEYYNVSSKGNWEHGKNILLRDKSNSEFAVQHGITEKELKERLENDKANLLSLRSSRIKPRLDDKILTSWNSLMISGLVDAYKALGRSSYLNKALATASFLVKHAIQENHELTRNYKNGRSNIHALLDDYAFTISSFINLYEVTFDEKWLYKANELTKYTLEHFFDPETGMFLLYQ